jgi:hypothetical protein
MRQTVFFRKEHGTSRIKAFTNYNPLIPLNAAVKNCIQEDNLIK